MIRVLFSLFKRMGRAQSGHGPMALKVAVATAVIIFFAASGFLYFEMAEKPDLSWNDAFWWAVVTMTTVGYGDYFPATTGGRYLIGIPTMIFGISVLGYLLSTVASFLIEARSKELKGMVALDLKDHVLLVHYPGVPRIAKLVNELRADAKTADKAIVLIADELEELPQALADTGLRFVRGAATSLEVLERACLKRATHAIVLAPNAMDPRSDDQNLAAVLTMERLNAELHTVCEVVDAERVALFYRAGADSVVCLASLTSNFLAQELLDPGVQRVLEEITNNSYGQQIYIATVEQAGQSSYAEVRELLQTKAALALGIERGREVLLNPDAKEAIQAGDQIICLAAKRPAPLRL